MVIKSWLKITTFFHLPNRVTPNQVPLPKPVTTVSAVISLFLVMVLVAVFVDSLVFVAILVPVVVDLRC